MVHISAGQCWSIAITTCLPPLPYPFLYVWLRCVQLPQESTHGCLDWSWSHQGCSGSGGNLGGLLRESINSSINRIPSQCPCGTICNSLCSFGQNNPYAVFLEQAPLWNPCVEPINIIHVNFFRSFVARFYTFWEAYVHEIFMLFIELCLLQKICCVLLS